MHDHQRIVDDLRNAMNSAATDALDFLRLAAADYSAVCDEANERLRKCDKLLKQGLRGEALQLCEVEPNLLDVIATLDFPEREQLYGISERYGLAPPPELAIDAAAELNEAYALQQPLDALLRKHRLLAIGRAPLVERLKVLRSLSQLDSDNHIWADDQKAFETERLKQIRQEAQAAAQAGNVAVLDALSDEMSKSEWRAARPADLFRSVKGLADKARQREASAELDRLEVALNDAFASFDVDEGRRLRERWNACQAICELAFGDEVLERARPALEWLEDQDEQKSQLASHTASLAKLERALEQDRVAVEELERLHHAAVRHGHDLPSAVEQRYQAKVRGLEFSSRRRTTLLVSAVAAIVLLTAAGIGTATWLHLRANELATATQALSRLIDDGKYPEAQNYLDQLAAIPRIFNSPQIQELKVKLDAALDALHSRSDRFKLLMQRVQEAGYDEPDHKALEEAEKLAETDHEKAAVADEKAKIKQRQREVQSARDAQFLKELDALSEKVKQLESDIEKDPASAGKQLQMAMMPLRIDLDALDEKGKLVSPALRSQTKAIRARLNGLADQAARQMEEQKSLDRVTKAIGNIPAFDAATQDYAKQHPNTARAGDFARVTEELLVADGMLKWGAYAAELNQSLEKGLTPATAKSLIDRASALTKELGTYPQATAYKDVSPQLASLTRRIDEEGQPIHQALVRLFKDRLVGGVWMIEHKDGQRRWYTTDARPDPMPQDLDVVFLKDFDGSTMNKKFVVKDDIKSYARAPQSLAAEKVLSELALLDSAKGQAEWDHHFAVILAAIYSQPAMEPVLKLSLLKRTVPIACQGSSALHRALTAEREALEKSTVNVRAKWMVPFTTAQALTDENKEVNTARRRAIEELKELAALAKLEAKVVKPATVDASMDEYRWVGALLKSPEDRWSCLVADGVAQSGELFVATQLTPKGEVRIEKIGDLVDGKAMVTTNQVPLLLEGRPVYTRVVEDKKR